MKNGTYLNTETYGTRNLLSFASLETPDTDMVDQKTHD